MLAGLVISPWVVRNLVVFNHPILMTTHGGYTLLLGNNSSFYEFLRNGEWGQTWDATDAIPSRHVAANELEYDRQCYQKAWQTMRSDDDQYKGAERT